MKNNAAIKIEGYLPLVADKSHGRIIWDCAWAHEGDIFATASRDKTVSRQPSISRFQLNITQLQVKIWKASDSTMRKWTAVSTIAIKESGATAVSFSPLDVHNWYALFGYFIHHADSSKVEDLPSGWRPDRYIFTGMDPVPLQIGYLNPFSTQGTGPHKI
jgi:hypothetical protein